MRAFPIIILATVLLLTGPLMYGPAEALGSRVQVRAGMHPDFFRVVLEGRRSLFLEVDMGKGAGERREVRVTLPEGTEVELPPSDTWKAGPVRSVRMEGDVLVVIADPTVPVKTRRLGEPHRYVFDFEIPAAPSAVVTVTEFLMPAGPSGGPPPPDDQVPEPSRSEGVEQDSPPPDGGSDEQTAIPPVAATPAPKPEPRLTPEAYAAKITGIRRVAIDPGHGGYDRGLPGEKEFALRTARRLERALGRAGIRTMVTRTGNSYVGIGERMRQIREFRPDVYVSIHVSRERFRVYTGGMGSARRAGLALKTRLQSGISLVYGDEAIGVTTAPVALTDQLPQPGALIEVSMNVVATGPVAVDTIAGIVLASLGRDERPEGKPGWRNFWR